MKNDVKNKKVFIHTFLITWEFIFFVPEVVLQENIFQK